MPIFPGLFAPNLFPDYTVTMVWFRAYTPARVENKLCSYDYGGSSLIYLSN